MRGGWVAVIIGVVNRVIVIIVVLAGGDGIIGDGSDAWWWWSTFSMLGRSWCQVILTQVVCGGCCVGIAETILYIPRR